MPRQVFRYRLPLPRIYPASNFRVGQKTDFTDTKEGNNRVTVKFPEIVDTSPIVTSA